MVLWSQEWRVYSTQQTSLVARSFCVMVDIEQAIQTCETEHLNKVRFNLSMHWNFCFTNSEWKFRYQSSQSGSCTLLMTSLLLSRAGWHRCESTYSSKHIYAFVMRYPLKWLLVVHICWYTNWGKYATVFGRTTKIYKEELGDLCRLDVECILCPYL